MINDYDDYDYVENSEEGSRISVAESILRTRLSLASYLRNHEIRFDHEAAQTWFWPRVTWEDFHAATGTAYRSHINRFPQWRPGLFGTNGKMIAPTWSLPPGPIEFGGTCPISAAHFHLPSVEYLVDGRPVVATLPKDSVKAMRRIIAGVSRPKDRANRWVCNKCYALKGQFQMPPKILSWLSLHRWVTEQTPSEFARNMIEMIRFNFERIMWRVNHRPDCEVSENPYYFRIHDAGDFYSKRYMQAWFEIAAAIPEVQFWAATRAWMLPGLGKEMRNAPKNMTMRPSEMFYDQPSRPGSQNPTGVASSMVIDKDSDVPEGVFLCPVTQVASSNCQIMGDFVHYRGRNTSHMLVEPGCRACWDATNLRIGYKEH